MVNVTVRHGCVQGIPGTLILTSVRGTDQVGIYHNKGAVVDASLIGDVATIARLTTIGAITPAGGNTHRILHGVVQGIPSVVTFTVTRVSEHVGQYYYKGTVVDSTLLGDTTTVARMTALGAIA